MFDLVIWDFNGTIVEDMMLCVNSVNRMLRARGLRELSGAEDYKEHFHFPVKDYYAELGFDFEAEPYEDLAVEWFDMYCAGEPYLTPAEGVANALEAFRAAGIEQIVLSASQEEILLRQLDRFGFAGYFSEIIGQDNIYAGGKTEAARKWIGGRKIKAAFIGDTVHDYQTACEVGAVPFLFAGGHGKRSDLETTGAFVSESMHDIKKAILGL